MKWVCQTACKAFQIRDGNSAQWFPPQHAIIRRFEPERSGVFYMDMIYQIRRRHLVNRPGAIHLLLNRPGVQGGVANLVNPGVAA